MNPLVSVSCITFNHSSYVEDCLEGIISQKTTFPFEILINDDASVDGTREIIQEYQLQYPKIIKPVFQSENQWSKGVRGINAKFNYPRAKGKYIALCEGDDYWTDPYKLQKQVDFLERNPEFFASFTNALIQTEGLQSAEIYVKKEIPQKYKFGDVLKRGGGFYPTATLVFRNEIKSYPSFFSNVRSGDRALILLLAQKGLIYYHQDITAVYRKHQGGIFSKISANKVKRLEVDLDNIKLLKEFDSFTGKNNHRKFVTAISNYSMRILFKYPAEIIDFKTKRSLRSNLTFFGWIKLIKNAFLKKLGVK